MRQKKYRITENENIAYNSWYIGKNIGMNMISKYQKQGYYMPGRQLNTIGQELWVKHIKEGDKTSI